MVVLVGGPMVDGWDKDPWVKSRSTLEGVCGKAFGGDVMIFIPRAKDDELRLMMPQDDDKGSNEPRRGRERVTMSSAASQTSQSTVNPRIGSESCADQRRRR